MVRDAESELTGMVSLFGNIDASGAIEEILEGIREIDSLELAGRLWEQEEFMQLRWDSYCDTILALQNQRVLEIVRPEQYGQRRLTSKPNPDKKDRIRFLGHQRALF